MKFSLTKKKKETTGIYSNTKITIEFCGRKERFEWSVQKGEHVLRRQ